MQHGEGYIGIAEDAALQSQNLLNDMLQIDD